MNQDDAIFIAEHLRQRDRDELVEYGLRPETLPALLSGPCVLERTFPIDGNPVAFVRFDAMTPKALNVSMMATDEWPRVSRTVIRWGRREAKPALLAMGYARAECRTMAGHAEAIALLLSLGFKRECTLSHFGASGRAFIQFAWRLSDHVPFNAEDTSPAPDAAA